MAIVNEFLSSRKEELSDAVENMNSTKVKNISSWIKLNKGKFSMEQLGGLIEFLSGQYDAAFNRYKNDADVLKGDRQGLSKEEHRMLYDKHKVQIMDPISETLSAVKRELERQLPKDYSYQKYLGR